MLTTVHPKQLCIRYEINIWYICYIMSPFLEPSTPFPYIS